MCVHNFAGLDWRVSIFMDLVRIGEKLVSYKKIEMILHEVLKLRQKGYSQKEISNKIGIERTFISKIEKLGEIRKGGSIAVIGFPLLNKEELKDICQQYGVDYIFLMTERQRWDYVKAISGETLLNHIMEICREVRSFDIVVVIGSDYRIRLIEALLGKDVVEISIGESPIQEDVYLCPDKFKSVLNKLT